MKIFSRIAFLMVLPGLALGNPTELSVRHGAVTIDDALDGTLRILQESHKAILDWRSFSISAGELTEFVQPSSTAAALNRVSGGVASQIDGQLLANGRVFLLNPAGVIIGASGRVDAAGFVASTLDVSDADFLASGDLNFRGDSNALVVNLGTIGASEGDLFLIANRVENAGSLSAPNGTVGLAAGNDVRITTGGDERVFVRASNGGAEGVVNTGAIEASVAELKAHGGNVYAIAIRNEGRVVATGVSRSGGQIFLGSPGGKIANSGSLETPDTGVIKVDAGPAPGRIENSGEINAGGGEIVLLGHEIDLLAGSLIISDGAEENGTITIGSPETLSLNLADGATIQTAGGTVAMAADQLMLDGMVSARGAENGGTISAAGREVAINGVLDASGGVNGGSVAVTSTDLLTLGATGTIQADGASQGGTILMDAGPGGTGNLAGTVSAISSNGVGGTVQILGDELNFDSTARVDVSGGAGGGSIFAGGGRRGENPAIRNSTNVSVAAGAVFAADATSNGDGGQVIVFAENALDFNGRVSATGGPLGGDGGFAELSGRETVSIGNLLEQVDLSAPAGTGGELLIDPNDIVINPGDGSEGGVISGSPVNRNTLYAEAIADFLDMASLTIETSGTGGDGDITMLSGSNITWTSNNSLTLHADRDIIFNSTATIAANGTGGSKMLFLDAARDILFNGAAVTVNEGVIDFNAARSVSLTNSTIGSTSGSIHIDANPTQTGGLYSTGVTLSGTDVTGMYGTDVMITGYGGIDTDFISGEHYGVEIIGNSTVTSTDTGAVMIDGTGGLGISSNHGVKIDNSMVGTDEGDLTINGRAHEGSSGNSNDGISVNGGTISSMGGDVAFTGYGGGSTNGTNGNNGVVLLGASSVSIEGGLLKMEGTGGGGTASVGPSNNGIFIGQNSTIMAEPDGSSVGGDVSIIGLSNSGGTGSPGVWIDGSIQTSDSDIFISGRATEGTYEGIKLASGTTISSGMGAISLTGNASGTANAIDQSAGSGYLDSGGMVSLISENGSVALPNDVIADTLLLNSMASAAQFKVTNAANQIDTVNVGAGSTDSFGFVSIVNSGAMEVNQVATLIDGNMAFDAPEVILDGNYATKGTFSVTGDVLLNGDVFVETSVGNDMVGDFAVGGDIGATGLSIYPPSLTANSGIGRIIFGGTVGIDSGFITQINFTDQINSIDQPSIGDQFLDTVDLTGTFILLNPTSGGFFTYGDVDLNVTSSAGITNTVIGETDIGGQLRIQTGDADDTVTFTNETFAFLFNPIIGGGNGIDTVDFSAINGFPIELSTEQLTSVENLIGSAGNEDVLTGSSSADDFQITELDGGHVDGINFSGIENLSGGDGGDVFTFLPGGDLSGFVDGEDGVDQLFIDNSTDPTPKNYTVHLNAVMSSHYDFLNINNVRIRGGSGNDTVTTDFFTDFTQTLDGGGGSNELTFLSPPNENNSPFTSPNGQPITASNFGGSSSEPTHTTAPGGSDSGPGVTGSDPSDPDDPDDPDADPDPSSSDDPPMTPDPMKPSGGSADTGNILQNETDPSMIFPPIGGDGGSGIIDHFTGGGDGNGGAQLYIDLDGDGIDDVTGFAANPSTAPNPATRKLGQPFFVITPDGFVSFDIGVPLSPQVRELLKGNVAPSAESELRTALGGNGEAFVVREDGSVGIDGEGGDQQQETENLLDDNTSDDAKKELEDALSN